MATFLRKFATRNEYSAATLTQPCVSLITSENEVVFDPMPYKALVTYDNGIKYNVHCDRWSDVSRSDIINNGYDYTKITDVIVGDCVSAVTNICEGFTSLTSVTIPNSVTTIGSAFKGCTSLEWLELPSSITKLLNYDTFSGCTNLQSITLYAETPPTCQYIDPLWGCDSAKIYVPENSVDTYKADSKWGVYADRIFPIPYRFEGYYNDGTSRKLIWNTNTTLTAYDVQERNAYTSKQTKYSGMTSAVVGGNVETIGGGAFAPYPYTTTLSSITIGNTVKTIGGEAFEDLNNLTEITIPSGVTSIGYKAFYGCSSLTSITCEAVTPPTIGYNTFANTNDCQIYVPSGSVEAYKTAWSDYSTRINAYYEREVSADTCVGVDKYVNVQYQRSYDNQTWETTATSQTLVETNSYDCGYRTRTTSGTPYCDNFSKFVDVYNEVSTDAGETWTTASTTTEIVEAKSSDCGYPPANYKWIATYANYSILTATCDANNTSIMQNEVAKTNGGSNAIEVLIGDCVTSIDSYAFDGFGSLTSFEIPSGITSIGRFAFRNCTSLQSITIEAVTPPTLQRNNAFNNTNDCPIYVPSGSVNAYKTANNWSTYASRIQAIPNS